MGEDSDFSLSDDIGAYSQVWLVSHELWGTVTGQISETSWRHLEFVPEGQSVLSTAGKVGTWLGKHDKKISSMRIVAHGVPGKFLLGEQVSSKNAAPLGGWLYSFFDKSAAAAGIQILGCQSAADDSQRISKYDYGQRNDIRQVGISHGGYNLLYSLAKASRQIVEGALHGQERAGLTLKFTCRRVYPNGADAIFLPAGSPREPGA